MASWDHEVFRELAFDEEYTLGAEIGQGAFGVVHECTSRASREVLAVKLVTCSEDNSAAVTCEIEFLRRLAHPRVIRLRDAYREGDVAALVMDLCEGGAVVDGIQRHWNSEDRVVDNLATCAVQRLGRMMLESIAWLRVNSIVHRDVKADNFLMNRMEIEDPNCHIFLADFDTAVELAPDQRLTEPCGTKSYWSPETYARSYSFGVDVWAVGVIMFGLVSGKFPFNGEAECRRKLVRWRSNLRATDETKAFVEDLLTKDDAKRLTAEQALQHTFFGQWQPDVAHDHVIEVIEEALPAKENKRWWHSLICVGACSQI